jgi:hypothetical protein
LDRWINPLLPQVIKPVGMAVSQEEVDEARQAYQQSCLRLADHFLCAKVCLSQYYADSPTES